MKKVSDFIPWKVKDISLRPYSEMWSMNPSIHFDGALWRCLLRCTDYALPHGVEIRSRRARPGEAWTKSAMVIFDPDSWKPIEIYKIHESDGAPRAPCENFGYEDIRIFTTDKGGLQGIAASLHLRRDSGEGAGSRNKTPEQVLLSFDANYDITQVRPIRGAWSAAPQKNWVPFDRCVEPMFLYSIGRGALFNERGALYGAEACARPALGKYGRFVDPESHKRRRARKRARAVEKDRERRREERRQARRQAAQDKRSCETLTASAGMSAFEALRGGTQLSRVGDDAWLGIGHEMRFVEGRKYYWHVWYLVDSWGKLKAASPPMKLVQNGIEFAAGMAIDRDRVVVSFGIDDMECCLGETSLSAVLEILTPVKY